MKALSADDITVLYGDAIVWRRRSGACTPPGGYGFAAT
ncbi:hypothetical protein ACVWXQ_005436 [Bradyrhizobium sp. S3.14.4]